MVELMPIPTGYLRDFLSGTLDEFQSMIESRLASETKFIQLTSRLDSARDFLTAIEDISKEKLTVLEIKRIIHESKINEKSFLNYLAMVTASNLPDEYPEITNNEELQQFLSMMKSNYFNKLEYAKHLMLGLCILDSNSTLF